MFSARVRFDCRSILLHAALWSCACLGPSTGCRHTVGVQPISHREQYAQDQRSALNSPRASERTENFLRRRLVLDRLEVDLPNVIEACLVEFDGQPDAATALVIAELSLLAGERYEWNYERAAQYYATSMLCSYTYLIARQPEQSTNPYDPCFRRACDFYNRALLGLVECGVLDDVHSCAATRVESLCGPVEFERRRWELPWPAAIVQRTLPTAGLEVTGFIDPYRSSGLGLPLIVSFAPPDDSPEPATRRFFPRDAATSLPATLVVRLDRILTSRRSSAAPFQASIEVYDPVQVEQIELAGQSVPLEIDRGTPFAFMLDQSPTFPLIDQILDPPAIERFCGLNMLTPYQRGRIPVVFLHGLFAPSSKWTQMINDLLADPRLRARFQFWEFQYATGNPLLYSAYLLRESLRNARAVCDPNGDDGAFDQMVIVGSSMGGLMARLCVSSGDDELWNAVVEMPRDQAQLSPAQQKYADDLIYFKPLPFVRKVIFMVTPHRGSKIADLALARALSKTIRFSPEIVTIGGELYARARPSGDTRPRSGIDNLSPDCPVLGAISRLPFSPGLTYCSIIANYLAADTPGGTDLIVEYESSHLADAASEKIILGTHDVGGRPAEIREVRRLLLEHLTATAGEHER